MEGFKIQDLLTEELVFLDVEADSDEGLIRTLAAEAERLGYVKAGWADAVIRRERIYPTGLPTEVMKVAVPHAMERDQVNTPVIIVATLKRPVNFKEMGDVGMFSDAGAMTDVKNARSKEDLISVLVRHLGA